MGIFLSGGRETQSVRRLASELAIRGSNHSGGKINTSSPRSHVFLCLHNVRIVPGRTKYIEFSIVKPNRSQFFKFIEYHSACFRRNFRPSSGVHECGRVIVFHIVPASKHSTKVYDI